ncbi:MAG: SDR family oxidoreductase [Firmicutes bacterium]|nr:SDR family oxidoreductase [Bacillota bacterium]
MGRLEGKVAIVTGSGAGQGKASAIRFAKEGAKVVVADFNEAAGKAVVEEIKANGDEAMFVKVDVSNEESVKNMVEETVKAYGKLNIIFNNAGVSSRALGDGARIENVPDKAWQQQIDVNLKGPFLGCKYAIPEIVKAGGGSVIITSSTAGVSGGFGIGPFGSKYPTGGPVAYTAAKSGIISMARALAITYGPDQVRVNVICPGIVNTQLMAPLHLEDKAIQDSVVAAYPLRRLVEVDDIANVALFLASDESSILTGNIIMADSGVTTY